jgi:hypothetical protein
MVMVLEFCSSLYRPVTLRYCELYININPKRVIVKLNELHFCHMIVPFTPVQGLVISEMVSERVRGKAKIGRRLLIWLRIGTDGGLM